MQYYVGERVAINLNIDTYKEGDEVLFGAVIKCSKYDKEKHSYLFTPILTIVDGDDGKTYYSVQVSPTTPSSPNTFTNVTTFKDLIEMKKEEINKEIDIFKEHENLYMEILTKRLSLGQSIDEIKSYYMEYILENMERLRNLNTALCSLIIDNTKYFDPTYKPVKPNQMIEKKDDENKDDSSNDDKGDT